MGSPVSIVRILVGVEVLRGVFREEFPCFANRTIGAVIRIGKYDLSSVGLQHAFALVRHVRRHAELYRESACRSDHGVSNAGISAGRIQQRTSVVKLPIPLGFANNIQSGTILH